MLLKLGCTVERLVLREDGSPDNIRIDSLQNRLLECLNISKECKDVPSSRLNALEYDIAQSDIVICDSDDGLFGVGTNARDKYIELVSAVNQSIWISISPYGLTGPSSRFRGNELTVLASGGLLNASRGQDGRPVKLAGMQGQIVGGYFAALAALHGLLCREQGGSPVHFDVSLQETVIMTSVFLECVHQLFECPGPGGAARYVSPRGLYQCRDGDVYLIAIENHQWEGLLRALGSPSWASGIMSPEDRVASSELIDLELARWMKTRSSEECMFLLQAEGVPAAAVNSPKTLLANEWLGRREFFQEHFHPNGAREVLPGLPASVTRTAELVAPGAPSANREISKRRYRVLDITHVLAGPLATSWLGTMGVDVVKVEDRARVDLYRRGPFARGEDNIEGGAYFAACNYSKRSFTLSETNWENELKQLAKSADVIVENLGAHRASQYGIGVGLFANSEGQGRTLISSSGFGRGTPMEDFRAYAGHAHAFGGLTYLTRDDGGNMTNVRAAWSDTVSAVWMAAFTLRSLVDPPPTDDWIDISMAEVVAAQLPEFFSYVSRDNLQLTSEANELDCAAPSGVYKCRGEDQWLALGIHNDKEWREFCNVLGNPSALTSSRFDHAHDRKLQSELDRMIEQELLQYDVEDIAARLQMAGLRAAPVINAEKVISDPHILARGLFQSVHHPVLGNCRMPGLPWTRYASPRDPITSPPLLGEHTQDVWIEWQGE